MKLRTIFAVLCVAVAAMTQPLQAQWSVKTVRSETRAVSEDVSGEVGGMAHLSVKCSGSVDVVFSESFDLPAGTSVQVTVGAWTGTLDVIMLGFNTMALIGSSGAGLVNRIRAGSQLDMRMGEDAAWAWSLSQSASSIADACGSPTRARPCCRICTTGKACGDSCISRRYTCRQPPGCACNGEQQDQESMPSPENVTETLPPLSMPLLPCPFVAFEPTVQS